MRRHPVGSLLAIDTITQNLTDPFLREMRDWEFKINLRLEQDIGGTFEVQSSRRQDSFAKLVSNRLPHLESATSCNRDP